MRVVVLEEQAEGDIGLAVDVTDGVRAMYDICIDALHLGSDYMTIEQIEPILQLAGACGFVTNAKMERQIKAYRAAHLNIDEYVFTDDGRMVCGLICQTEQHEDALGGEPCYCDYPECECRFKEQQTPPVITP